MMTEATKQCSKIKTIDICIKFFFLFFKNNFFLASMLAEAIRRTHNGESISVLFQ